ncbi:hypothetical protein VMUT_1492 [Vulcanisaeta moutnovskia 768-28]|uniref:ATPase AAA-type core domain-containing protein n=1 Tax=Vulcanisaeta moutnovskia (strain 768-28) TaxID=985053 RepID=F0QTI4_VULM7|nr:hypothetical protein [Vulcanisaeta moutnovskia]ADY01697.1 hypothetical protein VMUT_1492 [Vulcanisaeta moutnovskia 768-28]
MANHQLSITGKLSYGNKEVSININIDEIKPLTILIGPNLTGKSLTLICLAMRTTKRKPFMRRYTLDRIEKMLGNLRCETSLQFDYGVFVDSYRVSIQPLEGIREKLSNIKTAVESLKPPREEEVPRGLIAIENNVKDIENMLYEDRVIDDLKHVASIKSLADAYRTFDEVRDEFSKLIEETAKELEKTSEEYRKRLSRFMPLFIDRTAEGWLWSDLELNVYGENIEQLSSVYAPSLVVLYALLTYAMPGIKILAIEEPEVHAHPSMALFLGYLLAQLVRRSGGKLYVVASTHSMEFLRGALLVNELTNENIIGAYVFDRINNEITAGKWEPASIIPGFTEPGLFSYLAKVRAGQASGG